MKLGVTKNKGAGVITENGYILLSKLGFTGSLEQLISASSGLVEIKNKLAKHSESIPFNKEELDAPLRKPEKIVAIGLNFIDNASEQKWNYRSIHLCSQNSIHPTARHIRK